MKLPLPSPSHSLLSRIHSPPSLFSSLSLHRALRYFLLLLHCSTHMCSPSCRPLPSVRLNPSLLHYTTLGWQLHFQITLPVASPSHSLLSRIHSHPSLSPYMFPLRGH